MGYLSQRKKSERESFFLCVSSIVFILLTILSFMPFDSGIFPDLLFHFYLLNLLLCIYAAAVRRFAYSGLFLSLFIVSFFQISVFTNILFNTTPAENAVPLSIRYSNDDNQGISAENTVINRSGYLMFAGNSAARFTKFETNNKKLNLLKIDWSKADSISRTKAFEQMIAFIEAQDEPVIIYGRFGEPAWGKNMRELQKKTGLKVKNRLTFADEGTRFNAFSIPDFYVLGFANLGVKEFSLNKPKGKEFPLVLLTLAVE